MSTKQTTTVLTAAEIKYLRKVKSVELAIKTQGSKGMQSSTVIKVAGEIYNYINS